VRAESEHKLDREIEQLRERLEAAEEMRRAVVDDEVDGFVVGKNGEPKLVLLDMAAPGHRLILDRIYQGAVTVSDGGQVLYANQRFATMVGRTLAQLFAASARDLVVSADRPRFDAFLGAGTPDSDVDVALDAAGVPLVARITIVAVGGGHVSLLVTDVSARERIVEAEDALRAIRNGEVDGFVVSGEQVMLIGDAHRPYRALADRMEQGAATVSAQGDVIYANDRFATMVGMPRENLLGAPISPLLEGDPQVVRRLLAGGAAGSAPCELAIVCADGSRLPVGVAAQHVDGTDAITLVMTDLTEHNRHKAIEEDSQSKDRFLAVLAHELRNPLASIRNAIEVLQQRAARLADEERYSVELIERQTKTLVRLVDDLVDIHRLNQGKIILRRQPVELAGIIRDAIEAAQPYLRGKQHALEVSIPDDPVVVDADPVRLAQVLLNLLSNAAKFTGDGGRIGISLERRHAPNGADAARIRVSDNGVGVAPELLDRIFEPYVQLGTPEANEAGGLGLGLSVARRLIALHGGSIRAESGGRGHGTTLTIELPVCDAPVQAQARSQAAASAPTRSLRILVADDSVDAAQSLAMLLRLYGHETRIAQNGHEALDVADEFRPDIAVLDIDMPSLDGYQCARALREREWARDLVLYALTGWGQADDRRRASEAGFDSHFVKPVGPEDLARAIDAHRSSKRAS